MRARQTRCRFNQLAPEPEKPSKSLELLFDYTKFHIGVYLTLTAAYIAILKLSHAQGAVISVDACFLWLAVIFTMVAGAAGGVIASSITQAETTRTADFLESCIGPWEWKALHCNARKWIYLEHTSFWVGLIYAVLSFAEIDLCTAFLCRP